MRSLHGRAGTSEWRFTVFLVAAAGGVTWAIPNIGPWLVVPWGVAALAVSIRRLHDLGHSGWLLIIPALAGALEVGSEEAMRRLGIEARPDLLHSTNPYDLMLGGFALISLIVVGGFMLWLALAGGAKGPNAYGEV